MVCVMQLDVWNVDAGFVRNWLRGDKHFLASIEFFFKFEIEIRKTSLQIIG